MKVCLTNDDNRPIIGVLKINTENDNTTLNKTLYMKKAIFHEITHLFGFTFGILESLNMIEKENGIYYVNSSNVVMHAQKHFNCSNITNYLWKMDGEKVLLTLIWNRGICMEII